MPNPNDAEVVLRPKLVFWLVLLPSLPMAAFFSIWTTGFFGGILYMIIGGIFHIVIPTPIIIIGPILLFLLITFLFVFLSYKGAAKTEYRFLEDRIEYYEGFLSVSKKIVYYNKITDIDMSKGVFEKRYNLGSIRVSTAGSSGPEITILSIEEPEKWFAWLQETLKMHK